MPSTVVVTPTLDTAVSTASDTTQCKTVPTPDVQTRTTSTETVTGTDKPNMITPTGDQLETHKVTCGPCREKDTAASSESKDVVQDQSRIKADVQCPAVEMVITKVRSIFPSTGHIFKSC